MTVPSKLCLICTGCYCLKMSTEDKDYGQLVTLVSDMICHLIRKRLLIEAYVQLDQNYGIT